MKNKNLLHDFNKNFKTLQQNFLSYNTWLTDNFTLTKEGWQSYLGHIKTISQNMKETIKSYNRALECIPFCSLTDQSAFSFNFDQHYPERIMEFSGIFIQSCHAIHKEKWGDDIDTDNIGIDLNEITEIAGYIKVCTVTDFKLMNVRRTWRQSCLHSRADE